MSHSRTKRCWLELMRVAPLASIACGCAMASPADTTTPPPVTDHWATASQSTTLGMNDSKYMPPGVRCLQDLTCPFEGAEVPRCTRLDAEPVTLAKVGRTIRIRGLLGAGFSTTTQAGPMAEAPCYNRVTGIVQVQTAEGPVWLSDNATLGSYRGGFTCLGDKTAVCCGFSGMGEEAIAEGKLFDMSFPDESGPTQHLLYLQTTGFCRVAEASHAASNLARVTEPKDGVAVTTPWR